ncbi:formate dehydrogenase accessory sulfurtransferase FdhD [Mucilaginibacter sp. L196]|uniref:formate dehydrogenase accessory sulfurtransferase FdhD n=1 Tax=Mucilaginibacter sp. L196 TaxID=1641870 RepID=UPI00131DD695|nr:formate dehydrogenase accessory sulfurtransferase FdhD [Mucilaginibacter sp. L196]
MASSSITHLPITKINHATVTETSDALAIEEPLELRLEFGAKNNRQKQNISVTMRTPGNDKELALGFLFTEGIITQQKDVAQIEHSFIACAENKENTIQISLNEDTIPNLGNTERNFYTTSSCGVCGKGSINAIRTVSVYQDQQDDNFINAAILHELPTILSKHQDVFADTGGLHASALFMPNGELLLVREDVGRHNALDKLIGAAIKNNWLPLTKNILLLSGRTSFELVQKAAMAGITVIAAVGAPSSLAVELATEFNITLIGFLRNERFNIYTAAHRILIADYETTH